MTPHRETVNAHIAAAERPTIEDAARLAAIKAYISIEGKCRPAAMRAALEAFSSAEPAMIAIISRNIPMEGVCLAGRWKGWLFRQHRDGHWVSMHKLEQVGPETPGVLAALAGKGDAR